MTARTAKGQFAKGNSGKPKGARMRATRAVEDLMEGEIEALTRKCVDAAKDGDMIAMRLCLERLAPVRKGRPVVFDLPDINGLSDIPQAGIAILRATAEGTLSPDEAAALMGVIEGFRRAVETSELDARLSALEATREQ